MNKQIAVTTNSHRQAARLPKGATGGYVASLGSKTRIWYLDDTEENRNHLERFGIKIKPNLTKNRNEMLSRYYSI